MKKTIIHHFLGESICTTTIEIYNDYIIPKNLAVQIVKEFVETGKMANCVEWDEL